jgi:hypothetical protein
MAAWAGIRSARSHLVHEPVKIDPPELISADEAEDWLPWRHREMFLRLLDETAITDTELRRKRDHGSPVPGR